MLNRLFAAALLMVCVCVSAVGQEEPEASTPPVAQLHKRAEPAAPLTSAEAHDRLVQLIGWDRKAEGLVTPVNPHGLKWEFKDTGNVADRPDGHQVVMTATVYGAPRNDPWDVLVWQLDQANPGVQYKGAWVNLEGYLWKARPRDEAQEASGGDGSIGYRFGGAKGEAYRYMLLSKDQKLRIYGVAIPFPNIKRSGKCLTEVRLGTKDGRLLIVRGEGFAPESSAHLVTVVGDKETPQDIHTDAKGTFMTGLMPPASTEASGTRGITVSAPGCSMHFDQAWGKGAYTRE